MFRGTISTASLQRHEGVMTVPGVKYTIYVFDEALVIAPVESSGRSRWFVLEMLKGLPVAGLLLAGIMEFLVWIMERVTKRREEELKHEIEELPPDITVEQLEKRIENAHTVPTAEVSRLLVTPRVWGLGKLYLRFQFRSRDVDRYAYKRLNRQRQTVVSDPESAKAILNEVFGDRITGKWRTWAKSGRVGTRLGRAEATAAQ